jgi:hypothetical protein
VGPRAGLDVLRKKTLSPTGIRSPDRPARILFAIPSTLLQNQIPLLHTYFGLPEHVGSLIRHQLCLVFYINTLRTQRARIA